MKNRILILLGIIILAIVLSMIIPVKVKKWTYSLPNHYVIGNVSKDSVIIGKYVDGKLVTKKKGKTIGVSEYVEAFSYEDNYIYARTVLSDLSVNYYVIDSSLEKIYGSYELEGFLDKLKELELSTDIEWVQSTSFDK